MHRTVMAWALAALLTVSAAHVASQSNPNQSTSANAVCAPGMSGFYEGTATSKQAGVLSVSLNLTCEAGEYRGEFATPVGKFQVLSGSVRETTFTMGFGAGQDRGTLEAETKSASKLSGHFTFGDDSGSVELARIGEARREGYDKPTLQRQPG